MFRYFIYIVLLIIIFTSCNSVDKKTVSSIANESDKDSIINLTINGIKREFKLNKENKIDLKKLQDFLNNFPTIPIEYIDTVKVDINGDNFEENIISKIINKNGECITYSTILMNNKIIRQDTMKTNNDLEFMDWGNDSIYFKLKPYSSFFNALLSKGIVEDLENGKLNDGLIEFYTSGISTHLSNNNCDTVIIKHRIDSITKELKNYKGKIITTLEHWDRSVLIWNKNTEKLELIYTP